MKISQDVREYAAEQGIDKVEIALDKGMKEKAEEFKKAGAEIYSKAWIPQHNSGGISTRGTVCDWEKVKQPTSSPLYAMWATWQEMIWLNTIHEIVYMRLFIRMNVKIAAAFAAIYSSRVVKLCERSR